MDSYIDPEILALTTGNSFSQAAADTLVPKGGEVAIEAARAFSAALESQPKFKVTVMVLSAGKTFTREDEWSGDAERVFAAADALQKEIQEEIGLPTRVNVTPL